MNPWKAARKPTFAVRICGIAVTNVKTRLMIASGSNPVRQEVNFEDPLLGVLWLDDTLVMGKQSEQR